MHRHVHSFEAVQSVSITLCTFIYVVPLCLRVWNMPSGKKKRVTSEYALHHICPWTWIRGALEIFGGIVIESFDLPRRVEDPGGVTPCGALRCASNVPKSPHCSAGCPVASKVGIARELQLTILRYDEYS